jgi:acyl-CoA synthetase (NDP forming)
MALYTRSRFDRLSVPSYPSPEAAARAMKALVTYGEYLTRYGAVDERIAFIKKNCNAVTQ